MSDGIGSPASSLVSLYLAKRTNLLRFFTLRTSSAAEAEDIVQEIFLKIVELDAATIENPSAYLYRLGSNLMIDRARSRSRGLARELEYFKGDHPDGSRQAEAPIPSPEDAWEARSRLKVILAAIEQFPPKRQRVFIMHKIDGLSYAEVATTLGISRSAVEKHMTLALKQLAELKL